jgi:hypothetical protein
MQNLADKFEELKNGAVASLSAPPLALAAPTANAAQ